MNGTRENLCPPVPCCFLRLLQPEVKVTTVCGHTHGAIVVPMHVLDLSANANIGKG
uniref:Uncharacterized protein n=1 Tax=Arundo donax TaxID=35708 RepID=A0A0A9F2P4_ARUDO